MSTLFMRPVEGAVFVNNKDYLIKSKIGIYQATFNNGHWYPLDLEEIGCGCCGGSSPPPTHYAVLSNIAEAKR